MYSITDFCKNVKEGKREGTDRCFELYSSRRKNASVLGATHYARLRRATAGATFAALQKSTPRGAFSTYRFLKNKTYCAAAFPAQRANIKQEIARCASFVPVTTPIIEQNVDIVKQIAAIKCIRFFFVNISLVSFVAV